MSRRVRVPFDGSPFPLRTRLYCNGYRHYLTMYLFDQIRHKGGPQTNSVQIL
jgi:hypothetical protein